MFIAITLRYEQINNRELFTINKNFKDIFDKLGVTLVPVFDTTNIKNIAKFCDAIILTGSGIHINPKLYNQAEKINYEYPYILEDKLDFALIKEFNALNKPILGICRGIQVINVYFGGSLKQKINNHENVQHEILLKNNTKLHNIYKQDVIMVNSSHTQSIDKLAKNFKISATSSDNIIEGIEYKNIVGVQWHPEKSMDLNFFKNFIKSIKNEK